MRYGKSGASERGTWKVMMSSELSRRGLSNDMRHDPPFWIFNEIQKIGKWWRHRTQIGEGFRMIWITCRHFEYLMRYEKSVTSGLSMSKVMTSSCSSRPGLSNYMRRVPPFWIFNQIQKIGDIRRFDSESDDVIGLISARAFEWYTSRAAIFNIWSDTKNWQHPEVLFGKWWLHRIQLGKGFRMICVTCHNFEYLMRYEKSATSRGGRGKWWRHLTHLIKGFPMICVTCRHFEYLMRYE